LLFENLSFRSTHHIIPLLKGGEKKKTQEKSILLISCKTFFYHIIQKACAKYISMLEHREGGVRPKKNEGMDKAQNGI